MLGRGGRVAGAPSSPTRGTSGADYTGLLEVTPRRPSSWVTQPLGHSCWAPSESHRCPCPAHQGICLLCRPPAPCSSEDTGARAGTEQSGRLAARRGSVARSVSGPA